MARKRRQSLSARVWELARKQHAVIARRQLLALGASSAWVEHRIRVGRLHPLMRGVYAIGRPEVTRLGWLMAAVLRVGPGAFLSHASAAELWRMRRRAEGPIHVSTTARGSRSAPGIRIHRRSGLRTADVVEYLGIPVTIPLVTLVDIARGIPPAELEAAVIEADKLDLITPTRLRAGLEELPAVPGSRRLRRLLDRHALALTDSELERRFLRIVRAARLPEPLTQQRVNGFRVDFFWPDLGLVVETDGLRYHRTPAQQAKDRRRDQVHAAAGLASLRFTHAQVRYEAESVEATLRAVTARLRATHHAPAP